MTVRAKALPHSCREAGHVQAQLKHSNQESHDRWHYLHSRLLWGRQGSRTCWSHWMGSIAHQGDSPHSPPHVCPRGHLFSRSGKQPVLNHRAGIRIPHISNKLRSEALNGLHAPLHRVSEAVQELHCNVETRAQAQMIKCVGVTASQCHP